MQYLRFGIVLELSIAIMDIRISISRKFVETINFIILIYFLNRT